MLKRIQKINWLRTNNKPKIQRLMIRKTQIIQYNIFNKLLTFKKPSSFWNFN